MDPSATNVSAEQDPLSVPAETEGKLETSAISISDLLTRPDFPECCRGVFLNIGGTEGTVADIVGNSLKVKSETGTTMSFNLHVLKRLYGPREEQKPMGASFRPDSPGITSNET